MAYGLPVMEPAQQMLFSEISLASEDQEERKNIQVIIMRGSNVRFLGPVLEAGCDGMLRDRLMHFSHD